MTIIKQECPFCFGTGKRFVDIGDNNDVEVTCDDCCGIGWEEVEISPPQKEQLES